MDRRQITRRYMCRVELYYTVGQLSSPVFSDPTISLSLETISNNRHPKYKTHLSFG
ncbi:hypothetical protein BDA96_06G072700 [Sorghum bicolor]|uniref:Uncharacterized protein n=1 Tax=Sorghum bicolor TaxID=4558 RepID=A0A921UB86_SORBI|nr:hypothetical protein BDA96_06G072700 [Sorghum bicolor]